MGPTGSITGPQYFPSTAAWTRRFPPRPPTGPGMLNSTLTVPNFNGTFKIAKITVALNIAISTDSALTAVLIAPDGTQVPLFANVGGTGSNFINTVFDDAAADVDHRGHRPFHGDVSAHRLALQPERQGIDQFGRHGSWHLDAPDHQYPRRDHRHARQLVAEHHADDHGHAGQPRERHRDQFTIGFPQQQLSGTYTVQLGPNILDTFGEALDTNQNAGLDVLRGQSQNGPTTTVNYNAADLPKPIPAPIGSTAGQVTSTITVPDSFIVQGDTTSVGSQRPAGSDQPHLPHRPRPDGDAVPLRPERGPPGSGHPVRQRGQRHQHRQLHQHRLRRQRGHADPERRRAVLRHVQPAAAAGYRVRGHERPGDLDAGHPERIDGSGAPALQ